MASKKTQLDKVAQQHHGYDHVEVLGAREHNLKNIDVTFPRNQLVVITGLSGSGKSSLAFDTIYAEGQRRYIETFASYARSFIGELERPDVDKINGLSPVIAIEQKTTSRNPRSTVGTVTEIYDYLRLLFAKVADAYSYLSGHKMVKQTEDQIEHHLLHEFAGKKVTLLAPVVKGRKGHYRELFQQISSMGFSKVRIDGEIKNLVSKMQVDRYKIHDIEIVVDRILVEAEDRQRLRNSLHITLQHGKGVAMVQEETGPIHYFSKSFMDPLTGLSYDEPAPNTFSFNSPYGACPVCEGLGTIFEVDLDAIIPDKSLSIQQGGIIPLGPEANTIIFKIIKQLFKQAQIPLDTPIQSLPKNLLDTILYGHHHQHQVGKNPVYKDKTGKGQEYKDQVSSDQEYTDQAGNGQEYKDQVSSDQEYTDQAGKGQEYKDPLDKDQEYKDQIDKAQKYNDQTGKTQKGQEDKNSKLMPVETENVDLHSFGGIVTLLNVQADQLNAKERAIQESYKREVTCPECNGARLKKVSLYFKIADKNIAELANMNLRQLYAFLEELMPKLDQRQQLIAAELIKELKKRLNFLLDVGLYYLSLNRPLKTLSGGEAQRIRLATQIGTQLVGVLYILDEPSIGLHQRDNMRLIQALKDLRDLGNSVMVVEHDKDMMLHADYILDIGPGAGKNGGRVVAAGTPSAFLKQGSMTAEFLAGKRQIAVPSERRKGNGQHLILSGCTGNNLKHVTLSLPLGKLICITGVSGSGKSTLIHQTLYPILQKHVYRSSAIPLPYTSIEGLKNLDKVVEIDQKPIGRTPRSNPSTYTNVFSGIRNLFTQLPEAKIRGYQPGRFSFNVSGGRCETCQGGGMRVIEMDFLPDVYVHCETCQGKRYNRETLEVQYKGKSISDVLDMTISQAVAFFDKHPSILKIVQVLEEVGLGYLTLGQPATTLSGGEAQRVKLATELAKRDTGKTLYILDEPTTGLHFQDIQHLLDVLNKLTDKGNTVLVIEHNLDVIKVADYVIDMGPEGGEQGGQIIAQGTPEEIINNSDSYTAKFLKLELEIIKLLT